jgi:hypothetical protein
MLRLPKTPAQVGLDEHSGAGGRPALIEASEDFPSGRILRAAPAILLANGAGETAGLVAP